MTGKWIIFRMGKRYPELHETLDVFTFDGSPAQRHRAHAEAYRCLALWRERQPGRVFALGLEEHA